MYNKLYPKIIDALVKDGYIVLEDAFSESLCSALLSMAQDESAYKRAGISGADKVHLDNNRRRDKIRWLEGGTKGESEFLAFTKELQEHLNRELFLGLSYYEAHFARYDEGDFYEKHLDAFKNSKNRVVTTVYYLNKHWGKEDGGELVVYDENDTFVTKVVPKANTLVVFLSEKFPHEVLASKKKRYSIAGWFRVDKF